MRHTRKLKPLIGLAILGALLLTGCAPSPPEIERNAAGDLIPYEDLVVKHAFSWEKERLEIVDETHLRISYGTGPQLPCDRTNATVVETSETVTVTLLFGKIPDAETICKDEGTAYEMSSGTDRIMIETTSPIGNRTIIDGASTYK